MTFEEAREEIRKRQANSSAMHRAIRDLNNKISDEWAEIALAVKPFVPPYEEGRAPEEEPEYVVTGTWSCDDERNPAETCVYDDANDQCHDFCLFCGEPEERK